MNDWVFNLLDEDKLKNNINFAALFILNFECLKDFIVNQIKDFYCNNIYLENNELICEESKAYKEKVRSLDKYIDNASLKWFVNEEAITQSEYDSYQLIRKRRNEIVHELMNTLSTGFNENDYELFNKLIAIYSKLDKWWINQVEIPISGDEIPQDYEESSVIGGQAIFLSAINDIVINGNNTSYQQILEELRKNSAQDDE